MYATRRDWAYHEMQMHRRLWSCKICPYTSTVRRDFADHILGSHQQQYQPDQVHLLLETSNRPMEESAPQKCIFCHKQASLRGLMNHMAGHLEDLALFVLHAATDETAGEESSSVELSPLDSEGDDIWHYAEPNPLEEAGDVSEREFTCNKCDRTFDQLYKLKYLTGISKHILGSELTCRFSHHLRFHERGYECSFPACDKRFTTQRDLTKHLRQHERPCVCPFSGCDSRFAFPKDLDRHKLAHHGMGQEKPKFHCPEPSCPYFKGGNAFSRKDHLKRHMETKHHVVTS